MSYVFYDVIPDRRYAFVTNVGDGFAFGLTTGAAYHFVRGLRHGSPSGGGGLLAAGVQAARAHGPRVAGVMGAVTAVLLGLEAAFSVARNKREDHWSAIAAGAASYSIYCQMLWGTRAAALGAPIGASCIAVPLALGYFIERWHVTEPHVRKYLEYHHRIGP